jgi:hypothetical protein
VASVTSKKEEPIAEKAPEIIAPAEEAVKEVSAPAEEAAKEVKAPTKRAPAKKAAPKKSVTKVDEKFQNVRVGDDMPAFLL